MTRRLLLLLLLIEVRNIERYCLQSFMTDAFTLSSLKAETDKQKPDSLCLGYKKEELFTLHIHLYSALIMGGTILHQNFHQISTYIFLTETRRGRLGNDAVLGIEYQEFHSCYFIPRRE